VVREVWLTDSIEKQEPQPLEAYDLVSDLSVDGKGIPWDKQDPGEEAIESLSAEVHDLLFHTFFFFQYFIEEI
jgi:poly [ADP-ribose] polymerase 2/3/4